MSRKVRVCSTCGGNGLIRVEGVCGIQQCPSCSGTGKVYPGATAKQRKSLVRITMACAKELGLKRHPTHQEFKDWKKGRVK